MTQPEVDRGQFVTAVGGGITPDGRTGQLEFVRANGKKAYISFPMEAAATILLNIENALGVLFVEQKKIIKDQDPRLFFPIAVKEAIKIQGAISADGKPIVSMVLRSNVRLDFALEKEQIPALIAWLRDLEELRPTPAARN